MLRRLLSYLLISSLPLVLSGSLVSCDQGCKDLPFTPQLREYFLDFKEGSYWIYRNVANGDLDSVYFVSQTVSPEAVAQGGPVCSQESGVVKFKGMANNLRFGYYIKSWNNNLENNDSDITFEGDYDLSKTKDVSFGSVVYKRVIDIDNCCLSRDCYGCKAKIFRFLRLYFAPRVGLIRWEAENHPHYGNAVYELVRYNAVR